MQFSQESRLDDDVALKKTDKDQALSGYKITYEVLEALRSGDHRAYDKVYLHYKEPIEQFLVKLTGSSAVADDIAQEVFVTVWEKRESIDPNKGIKGYLFTIAKNAALKSMAREKMQYSQSEIAIELLLDGSAPDDQLIAKDTQLLIEVAVSNMPSVRRKVLTLYRNGNSYEQIAQMLDLTKGNVQKHISRARMDVKELVFLVAFFMLS